MKTFVVIEYPQYRDGTVYSEIPKMTHGFFNSIKDALTFVEETFNHAHFDVSEFHLIDEEVIPNIPEVLTEEEWNAVYAREEIDVE